MWEVVQKFCIDNLITFCVLYFYGLLVVVLDINAFLKWVVKYLSFICLKELNRQIWAAVAVDGPVDNCVFEPLSPYFVK